MHPAEFRSLRESLLLSEKDVSMLTLVKEAQIRAWEMGAERVPAGTAGLIRDIDTEIERRISKAQELVTEKTEATLVRFPNAAVFKRSGPDMSPIPPFLAFKCHCALIIRLRAALIAEGKSVAIRYFEN